MTEAEFYRAFFYPVVMAIAVLAFSKEAWPRRLWGAAAFIVVGAIVGFGQVWAVRASMPGWIAWAGVALLLAGIAVWAAWKRRRTFST